MRASRVILLHGIPTWSFLYNEVIALLAQHNRVIAPDFLGHGYSDRRDFFDRSLLAQTDMIILLLDHLGIERASFVGHDTGGGVALIMAIHHPERVARLVLTNVVAYDSWPIDDMIALGNPNWRHKSPKEVADFLASGLPQGFFNKERLTPEFKTGIVAPYSDEEGKISIIRNASALNTNHTTMLVERHGEIRLPTLCLWGVHDPWQTIHDGERLSRRDSERSSGSGRGCIALDSARYTCEIRRGGTQLCRQGLKQQPVNFSFCSLHLGPVSSFPLPFHRGLRQQRDHPS